VRMLQSESPVPLKKSNNEGCSRANLRSVFAEEVTKELTRQIVEDLVTSQNANQMRADLLSITPIHAIISSQELLFVKETYTVAEVIEILTVNKASFVIVLGEHERPVRTIDILDIVSYCNMRIQRNAFSSNLEIANYMEILKYQLTKSTLKEILPQYEWYGRTISATKSIKHLIRLICKFPAIKRVVLTDQKNVFGIVARKDLLTFLLANEAEFEEKMRQPLVNVTNSCNQIEENLNEMLGCAFQMMWEKQIVGKLASCKGSSSLDLFFNWLHYIHSASELINCESAYIFEESTVKEAIEHILREDLSKLFVLDSKTKKTISSITVSDLIELFL